MRVLPLLAAILLVGCGSGVGRGPTTESKEAAPVLAAPKPFGESKLYLLLDGQPLRLGVSMEEALKVYAQPESAWPFTELPPVFKAPYTSRGWETSRQGFGAIGYNQRVVLAMHQQDRSSLDAFDNLRALYRGTFPNAAMEEVTGEQARFLFLQEGDERIMVAGVQEPNTGALHTTTAVGLLEAMQAIGADAETVRNGAKPAGVGEVSQSKGGDARQ